MSRFFGLILLPLASFSAGGITAILFFLKSVLSLFSGKEWKPSTKLAKARPIDLSIQFALFWMPLMVLLGWAFARPVILIFGESERYSFCR